MKTIKTTFKDAKIGDNLLIKEDFDTELGKEYTAGIKVSEHHISYCCDEYKHFIDEKDNPEVLKIIED